MARKIKLVIFDLDGTLVNAYKAVYLSCNYVMKKFQLPRLNHITIQRSVGWGDNHLIKKFVGAKRLKQALLLYRRHHRDALKKGTEFLPGAKRILTYLKKQGYLLAIASNRPTQFTKIILEYLKINHLFNYVLCADKVKKGKPHPALLKGILKQLSLKPSQAIYVGDMTIDIETGKRAYVKTIAVATGSSTKKELQQLKPYKIIDKVISVKDILKRLNK